MGAARTIAVVIGGGTIRPPDPRAVARFHAVIAADSGLDVALAAGLTPTLLVGDLDSISPEGVVWATERSLPIERHPADKDDTDTALAVQCAVAMGATDLVLLGADVTTRLDHLLGTLICLGDSALANCATVTAEFGGTVAHVLHPGHDLTLDLDAGRVFSLLALHGDCHGVSVTGARWPLADAHVRAGSTLGISNESLGRPVGVVTTAGVLTVIVPEDPS